MSLSFYHSVQESEYTRSLLNFLWLEVTGRCNLSCQHCYAGSSPQGHHGAMHREDWERTLTQAAEIGCRSVQFIGGEPTTHPDLVRFVRLATELEMRVEIYTNLVSMKPQHWEAFQDCHVSIATSFYSLRPEVHQAITGSRYSFHKTVSNIEQVLARDLPLRVGLIDMSIDNDSQDIAGTKKFLADLGVKRMRVDQTRGVGRGSELVQVAVPEDALCGACAQGRAAVVPDGSVFPCVFSRHLTIGNVRQASLEEIIAGERMRKTRERLTRFFHRKFQRQAQLLGSPCMPATEPYLRTQDLTDLLAAQRCEPHECDPNTEDGECNPDSCQPMHQCVPDWEDPCNPAQPCTPMDSPCTPDMVCGPDDE